MTTFVVTNQKGVQSLMTVISMGNIKSEEVMPIGEI